MLKNVQVDNDHPLKLGKPNAVQSHHHVGSLLPSPAFYNTAMIICLVFRSSNWYTGGY